MVVLSRGQSLGAAHGSCVTPCVGAGRIKVLCSCQRNAALHSHPRIAPIARMHIYI